MKKILLLNPPGTQNYIRDYYCSKTSKSDYSYTPVDFLYIGSYLNGRCELSFIDCIVEKISPEPLLERIAAIDPHVIIALTGFVSWREDFALFNRIKSRFPHIQLVGSGDILLGSNTKLLMESGCLDAILYDFSSPEIIDYCLRPKARYASLAYRDSQDTLIPLSNEKRQDPGEINIGIPPHHLFPLDRYEYAFIRRKPFATVLTDYSCPYACTFCVMSRMKYRFRSLDNILKELDSLKSIGIREIYFADQTFGANRKNTKELLKRMIEKKYGFGWVCFTRVDVVNEEMIQMIKDAGCHTVIFGIEFGNDATLTVSKKNINKLQIENAVRLCQNKKIRTVGTFLLGEASQTVEDLKGIIDFSLTLGLDFASFNTYVPRVDDPLKDARSLDGIPCYDQSGKTIKSFSPHISDEELRLYHRLAVKKFYSRKKYLIRRLLCTKSLFELKVLFREGAHLFSFLSDKK